MRATSVLLGRSLAANVRQRSRCRPVAARELAVSRDGRSLHCDAWLTSIPLLELPLFPLDTVLYPGAQLQLRIFEPRYLDMVRDCARREVGFGVCLILDGYEVGEAALPAAVGTMATLTDFHTTAKGCWASLRAAARVSGWSARGCVGWAAARRCAAVGGGAELEVPPEFGLLQTILERLVETMGPEWRDAPRSAYDDASWLGFRLAELLPLGNAEHQRMLELTDPLQRLAELRDILPRFQKP